jgi:hypothetical protein
MILAIWVESMKKAMLHERLLPMVFLSQNMLGTRHSVVGQVVVECGWKNHPRSDHPIVEQKSFWQLEPQPSQWVARSVESCWEIVCAKPDPMKRFD